MLAKWEARTLQHNENLVHSEPRYIPYYGDPRVQVVTRGGSCTGNYDDSQEHLKINKATTTTHKFDAVKQKVFFREAIEALR